MYKRDHVFMTAVDLLCIEHKAACAVDLKISHHFTNELLIIMSIIQAYFTDVINIESMHVLMGKYVVNCMGERQPWNTGNEHTRLYMSFTLSLACMYTIHVSGRQENIESVSHSYLLMTIFCS